MSKHTEGYEAILQKRKRVTKIVLKAYRNQIEKEEYALCELCEEEDTRPLSMSCELKRRVMTFEKDMTKMNDMVIYANKCSKFLDNRVNGLRIDEQEEDDDDDFNGDQ